MPGVYFTTTEFLDDAKSAARDDGMPGIRTIALPADKYYRARATNEELQPIASAVIDQMVDDLVRPLTAEETKPSQVQKQMENSNITVKGSDFQDAYQKVNDLFLDSHWADGLPIVPPTPKLVKAMLAATTRSPGEVLGQVAPKNGTATVEKIAVNAVMAGAKPEYFPVILAAMDGFLDPHYDLTHVQASTGSFTPIVIVNGPLATELDFNSGIGMLGHGWRANSTVGRSLRLALLNLGPNLARRERHGSHRPLGGVHVLHVRRRRSQEPVGTLQRKPRFQARREYRHGRIVRHSARARRRRRGSLDRAGNHRPRGRAGSEFEPSGFTRSSTP